MKKKSKKILKNLLKTEFYSIDASTDFTGKREEIIQTCVDLGFDELVDELLNDMV